MIQNFLSSSHYFLGIQTIVSRLKVDGDSIGNRDWNGTLNSEINWNAGFWRRNDWKLLCKEMRLLQLQVNPKSEYNISSVKWWISEYNISSVAGNVGKTEKIVEIWGAYSLSPLEWPDLAHNHGYDGLRLRIQLNDDVWKEQFTVVEICVGKKLQKAKEEGWVK